MVTQPTRYILGAGSVLQHLIANGGNTKPPLFRRAMTSSTFLPSQYNYNDVIPEVSLGSPTYIVRRVAHMSMKKVYAQLLQETSCQDASDTLACLRAVDVSILQAANANISLSQFAGEFQWVPVIDGSFIRESPVEAITSKRLNGVNSS